MFREPSFLPGRRAVYFCHEGMVKWGTNFFSTPVLMHDELICIALSVCPSVCDWTKIQTGQKVTGPQFIFARRKVANWCILCTYLRVICRRAHFNVKLHFWCLLCNFPIAKGIFPCRKRSVPELFIDKLLY